jgi:hypothetical protein
MSTVYGRSGVDQRWAPAAQACLEAPESPKLRRSCSPVSWVAVGAAAAVLLAAYALDDIAEMTGWRFATWIAIAYIVSRGIAKPGHARGRVQPGPSLSSIVARRQKLKPPRWVQCAAFFMECEEQARCVTLRRVCLVYFAAIPPHKEPPVREVQKHSPLSIVHLRPALDALDRRRRAAAAALAAASRLRAPCATP